MQHPEFDLYPEVIRQASAAGVAECFLVVPIGEKWLVATCLAYHTDAAARDSYWELDDGVTAYNLNNAVNRAMNVRDHLYETTFWNGLFVATPTILLSWNLVAIAAGAIVVINALVYKLRGLPVEE